MCPEMVLTPLGGSEGHCTSITLGVRAPLQGFPPLGTTTDGIFRTRKQMQTNYRVRISPLGGVTRRYHRRNFSHSGTAPSSFPPIPEHFKDKILGKPVNIPWRQQIPNKVMTKQPYKIQTILPFQKLLLLLRLFRLHPSKYKLGYI